MRIGTHSLLVADGEVEVHHREAVGPLAEVPEQAGREGVYAGKGVLVAGGHVELRIGALDLPCLLVHPSHQAQAVVKEQVTGGLALAHQQQGGAVGGMAVEVRQVHIAQYVYVVYQERLAVPRARQQRCGPPAVHRSRR